MSEKQVRHETHISTQLISGRSRYRATCECTWIGQLRHDLGKAEKDAARHVGGLPMTRPVPVEPERIEAAAEALHDSLVMLGVDPDERPEHGGETTGETLARMALAAAGRVDPLRQRRPIYTPEGHVDPELEAKVAERIRCYPDMDAKWWFGPVAAVTAVADWLGIRKGEEPSDDPA